MRRSATVTLVVLGLAAMVLSWLLVGPWGRSLFQGPHALPEKAIAALPQAGIAEDQIKRGNLDLKYLTAEELKELRISLDLENVPYLASLNLDRWAAVLPMDALPAITGPEFTTVAETDRWLKEDDLVLGIVYRGIPRAYPVRILDRHEIVNDRFGDEPVVVTYCPLCFSGVVFKRPTLAGRVLDFGVSGRLYNANLLMYDRQTGSLWSQFTGEVIAGPLLGKAARLERIPADIVSWQDWREAHPQTQVLARPTKVETPRGTIYLAMSRYDRYPYDEYLLKPQVGFGVNVEELDLRGMNPKRKVIGVVVDGRSKAYVEYLVNQEKIINDLVGEEPLVLFRAPDDRIRAFRRVVDGQALHFEIQDGQLLDQETGTLWNFDGEPLSGPLRSPEHRLEELLLSSAFWFAWVAFYPDTELYPEPKAK